MEFLGNLGIDIKLLIAQIINFGLLLWLLKKFLYQPIIKRIEKDERELSKGREERKELEKERAAFARQRKEEVYQAREQATQIIVEAEEIAEKIKERARREAEKEKLATIQQLHARLKEIENDQKKQ